MKRRLTACVRPHGDEFWFGYLMRLADMNGYRSVAEFESHAFNMGRPPERHGGVLYPSDTARICHACSGEPLFPGVRTVVDRMTTYRHDAAMLPAPEQARLLEHMMSSTCNAATPGVMSKNDKYLRFCPACMDEDRKRYGCWYLHTAHQYREARTCAIHGCRLRVLKVQRGTPFSRVGFSGEEIEEDVSFSEREEHPVDIRFVRCPVCGTGYMVHAYSEKSGMPCPVCSARQDPVRVLQDRLDAVYGGDYRITSAGTTTWTMTVEHVPCGSEKRNIELLLWKKRCYCASCRELTAEKMQKRVAPGFTVVRMLPRKRKGEKTRMIVRHEDCGREFDIQPGDMANQPRCRLCMADERWKDMKGADPDYEVIEVPPNNRGQVLVRHRACGVAFLVTKQSYMQGARCPICTPKYSYRMVEEAVRECAPDYSVKRHDKRGYVILYKYGIPVRERVSYREVIQDLVLLKERVITGVEKPYVPPVSKRAEVYMEVKEKTREKGCWTHADGIGGKPVTARQQNILQELTDRGFISRTGKGGYRVEGEGQ